MRRLPAFRSIAALAATFFVAGWGSSPLSAAPFFFSTGNPDGKMAGLSQPGSAGKIETENADDFILSNETILTNARIVRPDEVIRGSARIAGGIVAAIDIGTSRAPGAVDLAGDYLLPAIDISWWNVGAGKVELAHLDAVPLQIAANPTVQGRLAAGASGAYKPGGRVRRDRRTCRRQDVVAVGAALLHGDLSCHR